MSIFTAERRTKEIGIRKVMGSNEIDIVRLLSGEFTRVVTISILIAIPIAYLVTHRWLESLLLKTLRRNRVTMRSMVIVFLLQDP